MVFLLFESVSQIQLLSATLPSPLSNNILNSEYLYIGFRKFKKLMGREEQNT